MATIADQAMGEEGEAAPELHVRAKRNRAQEAAVNEPDYVPPDFSASRKIRIGSSFIEQFVAGHDAGDVLRELVQNEFDGGGGKLTLTFGSRSLEVIGTGRNIDSKGWERLSVIVGTGNVMGNGKGAVVAPKENGIGSKNFGLRSLFRFGDFIHVRSGGTVALLDLQTQETGREADLGSKRLKGVRINVPYRAHSTERLEAFTIKREHHSLGLMANDMPDTLVKLALAGKKPGLREVNIRSIRTGRTLQWKQEATEGRCRLRGVTMVVRKGRLLDNTSKAASFHEEEFSRSVSIPNEYAARSFPAYYRLPGGRLRIAVSVPVARKRINLSAQGHYYYPLKAPSSRTGLALSISAPFELNTDRSGIIDHAWNDWLIDQALDLTFDLLKGDWFARYGADAFKTLIANGPASPPRFSITIAKRLSEDACWPTRANGAQRYVSAEKIVLPTEPELGSFLDDKSYLYPTLADDTALVNLVANCGAKRFSLASLIRLRCAGMDKTGLATKLGKDADFCYTEYDNQLTNIYSQIQQASALSALFRKLTRDHNKDLSITRSTLSATGTLRPANELMIVDPELWIECPEPEANRLHPRLVSFRAISRHCRLFDEDRWFIDAAERAATAEPQSRERETLYRTLLQRKAPISRPAIKALRANPVVKNQRGEWVAPHEMVNLPRTLARLLDHAIDAPSPELLKAPPLLNRLRIRDRLAGSDLIRFARTLTRQPTLADRFEQLLGQHLKLLSPSVVDALIAIPCIKARSGKLVSPEALHLDSPTNRLCIGDDARIVAGTNGPTYHKLRIKSAPDANTLLDVIRVHREDGVAPPRPDLLYPALVEAIRRERRSKSEIAHLSVCWVQNSYHAPSEILVGSRIPAPLAEAVPIYRHSDGISRAYQDLGAPATPNDGHWARFFRRVGASWAPEAPINAQLRRILLDAYRLRGTYGLPQGLDDVRCLADDLYRLYTLAELRAGQLVEPDFPALQRALRESNSKIGVIEKSDRSRDFYAALGIRPLSAIAGASELVLGPACNPPFWFKSKQLERALAMLHRPVFARALSEVAYRSRHAHAGFRPSNATTIESRLSSIVSVDFFQTIHRRHSVSGASVVVPAQLGLDGPRLALVPPKNKTTFQLLLAEALAEIAGATSVATMRGVANAFLPLLLCGTNEELTDYLEMQGIVHHRLTDDVDDGLDLAMDDDSIMDDEELALRQIFDNLHTGGSTDTNPVAPLDMPASSKQPPAQQFPTHQPTSVADLPDMVDVKLTVVDTRGAEMRQRDPSKRGGGGSSAVWLPPSPEEVARAERIGKRGEALIYRLEIEKVRAMGFDDPERYVIWTARDQPGADHDIRSIDAEGRPRWLEVKSTAGVDGRFDWPRNEFEKALRERGRYELWRVYRVLDREPIAKCFPNPTKLLGTGRIALELAGLRANIEGAR